MRFFLTRREENETFGIFRGNFPSPEVADLSQATKKDQNRIKIF